MGGLFPADSWMKGESLSSAAVREALEETSLNIRLLEQFFTYSNPKRDPRSRPSS